MAKGVRRTPGGAKPSKANLPAKVCAACARPFAWRKKWSRDWESVKYCSERCRRARAGG